MLTLKILDETDTKLIYANQLSRDFPPSELKRLKDILAMMRRGVYEVLAAYEGGELCGYALMYVPRDSGALLLDYLAVEPHRRGRGDGSAILALLRTRYAKAGRTILIECERPKAAPDEAQARRRIRFYQHAGAVMTNVRIWLFEVEYSILALTCGEESVSQDGDWAQQILTIYRQMLPEDIFARKVRLLRS